MSVEQIPQWVVPEGGITAADLDRMPGLPPHTELIDGGLFFISPQKRFHMKALYLLETGLRAGVPAGLSVAREMSVILSQLNRPEPDLLVATSEDDGGDTWYPAAAVLLAVEVVSPESRHRDRERKPQLYAKAGIRHFWRIEENDGLPVVHVYELDLATSSYWLSGIYHDRLTLTVPYDVDIDLRAITQL